MIVLVSGLPGSGKSFFASQLAKTINAVYINSDLVRKQLFDNNDYSSVQKLQVYEAMLIKMQAGTVAGKNVVVDATFHLHKTLTQFIKEASRLSPTKLIVLTASEQIIKKRLEKKRTDSDADFEVYKKIKAAWEIYEGDHLLLESTNENITDLLDKAAWYLQINHDDRANK